MKNHFEKFIKKNSCINKNFLKKEFKKIVAEILRISSYIYTT